jgi:hypothetical protein
MKHEKPHDLVLSIYPFNRGFAFVLFEGPNSPFDWGVRRIRRGPKNERTVAELKSIIDRFRPEVLVIEDTSAQPVRRTSRIRRLYRMLVHLAHAEYVEVHQCSKD